VHRDAVHVDRGAERDIRVAVAVDVGGVDADLNASTNE
jgi:hypothetical protein